jgi:hypothetical protein
MKDDKNITLIQGNYSINYSYNVTKNLTSFINDIEHWITSNGYDLNKVKLITSIIFLNMSPLHDEKFSKMLWFKSIEMMYELTNK